MSRVALHTLGCKLNFAETATLARQFTERGFTVVDLDDPADVVVVNTCSVTERADRECRQIVRRALRHSPDAYVIVVGCYAQLQPATIASIPGVDLVLGTQEKFDLFDHADWKKQTTARTKVSQIRDAVEFRHAASGGYADRTRAFLKIQDGCDYHCSFCTIPLARGQSRSVSPSEIVHEARSIVDQGYREIVLTGVNVGDYGKRTGSNLRNLLAALEQVDGLERIRISSIEPNLLTDDLLDFWLDSAKICRHFHIPLQSGSDSLLRRMRRRYPRSWYADRVARIKARYPSASVGSDVIVGFPGESDDHFEETYTFLVDQPVSYLHVFTYSERPGTPALSYEGAVAMGARAERSERLRMLGMRKRRAFYESFIGKKPDVLFEARGEDGLETGLSGEYVRVKVISERRLENELLPVTIERVDHEACYGSLDVPVDAVVGVSR